MSTASDTDAQELATGPETGSAVPRVLEDGNESKNVGTTSEGTDSEPGTQRKFGSLSPSEAGRRSAQARRDRKLASDTEAQAASDGRVLLVRVPVQIGDIIASLATRAKKGDTGAARELRAYLTEYPAEDETDLSVLDRRTRQQVLAHVLADIEEEEGDEQPSGPVDRPGATPLNVGTPAR